MVKNVSKLLNRFGSTPTSGFRTETRGYSFSSRLWLFFRWSFHFLSESQVRIGYKKKQKKKRVRHLHQSWLGLTGLELLRHSQARMAPAGISTGPNQRPASHSSIIRRERERPTRKRWLPHGLPNSRSKRRRWTERG